MSSAPPAQLTACHECDSLQQVGELPPGRVAYCHCCGARLWGHPKGGIDSPLALMLGSLILFLVANAFPLLTMEIRGLSQGTTLSGAALALYRDGMPEVALIVWCTSVLIPGIIILATLYVLIGVRFSMPLPWRRPVLIAISHLQPWGMLDVFMLGVLVALVKLAGMADIILGTGLYAFVALIFCYAAASARLEVHMLWDRPGADG